MTRTSSDFGKWTVYLEALRGKKKKKGFKRPKKKKRF